MIKNLNSGPFVEINGGHSNYPYISPGSVGAGMVRYNNTISAFEVNDGMSWQQIPMANPTIGLTGEARDLLEWARKKKAEEEAMWAAPNDHPAVKAAKEYFNQAKAEMMKAEQQLKATVILSKDYEKSTS